MAKIKKTRKQAPESSGFRIGTVSQLTGIDPHTIRAWERRHQAIEPTRSEGGSRRYDDSHVARLQLIKAAVDAGDAISTVAKLSDKQLRARLADLAGMARKESARELEDLDLGQRSLRVGVLGARLVERLRVAPGGLAQLEIAISEHDLADFSEALGRQPVDVMLVSVESLGPDPVDAFKSLQGEDPPRVGIVIYEFSRRAVLAGLADAGAKLLKGPLLVTELRRAVFDSLVIHAASRVEADLESPLDVPNPSAVPERLFTDRQIARLSEIASSVECECPNHLSQLIASLLDFERYSNECVNRSTADQRLHQRLALGTARARHLIEQLLTEVCDHDGIRL